MITSREDTVATIKTLISSFYVFEDLAAHPPTGEYMRGFNITSVDLLHEIDQLLEKSKQLSAAAEAFDIVDIENEEEGEDGSKKGHEEALVPSSVSQPAPMTHREFHDGLSGIILRAHDEHFSYNAECSRAFKFNLAFGMEHIARDGHTLLKDRNVNRSYLEQNRVIQNIRILKSILGIVSALALIFVTQANSVETNALEELDGQEQYSSDAVIKTPQQVSAQAPIVIKSSNKYAGAQSSVENEMVSHPLRDPEWDADLDAGIERLKDWAHVSQPEKDNDNDDDGEDDADDTYKKPVRHDVQRPVDPCTTASKLIGGHIPYDVAKACLDANFAFPSTSREDTVATIKTLISSFYVFEDLAAHPPTGEYMRGFNITSVDLLHEIDQLLEKSKQLSAAAEAFDIVDIENEEEGEDGSKKGHEEALVPSSVSQPAPMTHREFHDGLSGIILRAHDEHFSYNADCFRAFKFRLGFIMENVVRDGQTVLKVREADHSFGVENNIIYHIYNCDVVTIGGKDAVEYVQDWADSHTAVSKDPNVRFNGALSTQLMDGFYRLGWFGEQSMLPDEPSLVFEFQCPGRQDLLKADVKWVATYAPSEQFRSTSSYYNVNCIKPKFASQGSSNESEEDKLKGPPSDKEKDADQRTIRELKLALRDLLMRIDKTSAEHRSSVQGPSESLAAPRSRHGVSMSNNNPMEPEQDVPKKAKEILTQLDLISPPQLPLLKFYDIPGKGVDDNWKSDSKTYTELYKGPYDINALLLDDGITGVLTIGTEASDKPFSKVHPEWVGALIQAIDVLRPQAENLILDLSHNNGGFICLGMTMLNLFFPDHPREVTNVRLSPLGTHLMTAGAMRVYDYTYSYGESKLPAIENGLFSRSVSHPHRPNMTFTDYLSDRCTFADQYVLKVDPVEESKRKRASATGGGQPYYPWDPENMAILTNGYCGSTCALISNMMHTKFGVKTVVVGGRTPAATEPMSYSTFPGLEVVDDKYMFDQMHSVRMQMMSVQEVQKLEQGRRVGQSISQTGFSVDGEEKVNGCHGDLNEDDEDEDEDEDERAGVEMNADDSDLDSFYPLEFAHKCQLRLTWRQIYNTGAERQLFVYSAKTKSYEPAWQEVERWNEYSFIPGVKRIDYTEDNVRIIERVWADARDAIWGPPHGAL
ncbi:hypothetical protein BGX28_005356 [Mortierella sp. GBA30]|nr:hypothetical protein BGX28_005356 [Mortierella sp. GBA30]